MYNSIPDRLTWYYFKSISKKKNNAEMPQIKEFRSNKNLARVPVHNFKNLVDQSFIKVKQITRMPIINWFQTVCDRRG
jgi:hypothetical protein